MTRLWALLWLMAVVASSSAPLPPAITFFCELNETLVLPFFQNTTLLKQLQQTNITVSLGTVELSSNRASAVRLLNTHQIPVVAWLLLPKSEGYWFNMDNMPKAVEFYGKFKAWVAAEHLNFVSVGFDLELDEREEQDALKGDWLAVIEEVMRNTRKLWESAREGYQNLGKNVVADGYKWESYIVPLVYDDRIVNTTALEQLLSLVDIGCNGLTEVPMLYSSSYPEGKGVLESYMQSPGGIQAAGLGSTGSPGSMGGAVYRDWEALRADMLYSYHHHGVSKLYIYSLEGAVERGWIQNFVGFNWRDTLPEREFVAYRDEAVVVDLFRRWLHSVLPRNP